MIHNSSKIHSRGVEILSEYLEKRKIGFEKREGEPIKDWVQLKSKVSGNMEYYPVIISVKPHTFQFETMVTGMNLSRIGKYAEKQKDLHRGIYCIFVDAAYECAYGQFLAILNNKKVRDRSLVFPIDKIGKGQTIRYWSVEKQFENLIKLSKQDCAELRDLHILNGTNENQINLF